MELWDDRELSLFIFQKKKKGGRAKVCGFVFDCVVQTKADDKPAHSMDCCLSVLTKACIFPCDLQATSVVIVCYAIPRHTRHCVVLET